MKRHNGVCLNDIDANGKMMECLEALKGDGGGSSMNAASNSQVVQSSEGNEEMGITDRC